MEDHSVYGFTIMANVSEKTSVFLDTAKNRKIAGELRTSVCFAIRMGCFDYATQFPNSPNLKHFGLGKER